ncbi:hypothetical protein JL108_05455 [Aeromicrobium sp. YIM 150415]|uniref:hypothetical protein n=1 Tax=Aeromicrobium sp. YIM 150415 TaxID=2803912 RepID=UPI0019649E9E|nr:hypothetical protein [Aeromicrobium sp. YIM 150415]MBM9462888.1 hypothetical protein [Aeromicrobium sp. YIM 150415]
MGRRRAAIATAGIAVLAPVLTSCGGPAYEHETACSIPADVVGEALGTDRFEATAESLSDVPVELPEGGSIDACFIETDDDTLRVLAQVRGKDFLREQRDALDDTAPTFELGEGTARVTDGGGTWICGNVWLHVVLDEGTLASTDAMREALETLADVVGCYEAASG